MDTCTAPLLVKYQDIYIGRGTKQNYSQPIIGATYEGVQLNTQAPLCLSSPPFSFGTLVGSLSPSLCNLTVHIHLDNHSLHPFSSRPIGISRLNPPPNTSLWRQYNHSRFCQGRPLGCSHLALLANFNWGHWNT